MQTASEHRELTAGEAEAGERLDRFLASALPEFSRARIQGLIKQGRVTGGGGAPLDPNLRIRAGDCFRVEIPAPEASGPTAEKMDLAIVHEDADVIVLDKPAGLVVHPAAGHATGTLVNALMAHCGESLSGIGGVKRPGIVHRLDKDTSGLLVVAKSDVAHKGLSEQFAAHGEDGRLVRTYFALVWGVPDRRAGQVEARLQRSEANRLKIAVARGDSGRHAVTHYEVVDTFITPEGKPFASLLRLTLETGRTHQIRVHMAHIGHPVIGDATYGAGFKSSARTFSPEAAAALDALGRQALHAAELGFEHPVTGKALHFTSALPADMERLRAALAAMRRPAARSPVSATEKKRKR